MRDSGGSPDVRGVRDVRVSGLSLVNQGGGTVLLSVVGGSPGGSPGQIQWNSGGLFAGAAALTYATAGTHLLATSQAVGVVPIAAQAAAGQTAHLFEARNSGGAAVSAVGKDGWGWWSGAYDETTTAAGVYAGVVSGTPRLMLAPVGSTGFGDNAQIDLQTGNFRFIHGTVLLTLSAADGGAKTEALSVGSDFRPSFGYRSYFSTGSGGVVGCVVRGATGQTASLQEWQAVGGGAVAAITAAGGFAVGSMADTAAPNGTLYYSTTAGKLVFKDAGGTVQPLY